MAMGNSGRFKFSCERVALPSLLIAGVNDIFFQAKFCMDSVFSHLAASEFEISLPYPLNLMPIFPEGPL